MSDAVVTASGDSSVSDSSSEVSEGVEQDSSSYDESGDETETRSESKPKPKPTPKPQSKESDDSSEDDSEPKKQSKPKEPEERKETAEERKWRLKINGKEREVTEAEAQRRLQMEMAAEERFQQASEKEKQVEQLLQALREDPIHALERLGVDWRDPAIKRLANQFEREAMDPTQRELLELREFKEAQERQQQELQIRQQQEAQERQQREVAQKIAQDYDQKISKVMQEAGLPRTADAVKRVAAILKRGISAGYDLDVETAADLARQEIVEGYNQLFGSMDLQQFMKFVGDQRMKEIRKYDLDRLRKQKTGQKEDLAEQVDQATRPTQSSKKQAPKFVSTSDWEAFIMDSVK